MSAITNPVPSPVERPKPQTAPPIPEEPKSRKGLIVVGALIVVAIGAWVALSNKQEAAAPVVTFPTVKVTAGTLNQVVRVTGQTSARNYANIIAPRTQGPESNRPMVLLELIPSGTKVTKGQVVAKIDGQSLVDHIEDTQTTVDQAESDVKKRRAEQLIDWENLQQTIKVAKADMDKANLEAKAAEVRTEVERMLLQLSSEEATARYKQLQSDIENTRKKQASEMRILELTLERHKRHINRHINDLKRFQITTPIAGIAVVQQIWGRGTMKTIEQGDQVSAGQPFMKVVDPSSMQVEARVNQAAVTDMRIGQEATIGLDAFPGFQMKGKVYSIGALAVGGWRQNFFIRTVPVNVAINGSDPKLIPDLSAACDIVLEKPQDGLLIPQSAVKHEKDGDYVEVKKGQNFERRKVELGAANDLKVIVKAGLADGDEIRLRF